MPSLVFHSTLCILAVSKCPQWVGHGYSTRRMIGVLIRDSAIYFGGFCVVTVVNMLIWAFARVRKTPLNALIAKRTIVLTITVLSS